MRIKNTLFSANHGCEKAGRERVQINGANGIIPVIQQQKKEQAQVVFSIKQKALFEKTSKSFLFKRLVFQWNRVGECPPDQQDIVYPLDASE